MWHQPCNNQTALEVHHLVDIQKEVGKASHLITVANDRRAMGLLQSREQCRVAAIVKRLGLIQR